MGKKIALGLGNNIDYEIEWNSKTIENLILKYDIRASDLQEKKQIRTIRDLLISILSMLKTECGGEIHVTEAEVINNFSSFFRKKITLGGTSVRAAIAMDKIGFDSALHLVTINNNVLELLPENCEFVCSSDKNSLYPHLIVQYDQSSEISAGDINIKPKRANRLIYVNDPDNDQMKLDPKFKDLINEAKVFLISGFNAMHDYKLLESRLDELIDIIQSLPESANIFYEDGCYHNHEFSHLVQKRLMKKIDIYSLNEDEMSKYLGKEIDLLDPEDVLQALIELSKIIQTKIIVVHSRYWALAYGKSSAKMKEALKGGVCMSNTRFRLGDNYTKKDYQETSSFPAEKEGYDFSATIEKISESLVCSVPSFNIKTSKATTIGLGDSFVGGFLPSILDLGKL